jgi:hypothetical protein
MHQPKIPHQSITINSQRCASTKHNTTTHNHHQDQYVLLIIYQYKYATSSINHVSTILLTSALQPCTKYVPITYQLLINYDSSRCTNIINYTPHVCVNSSTTCLNHVPNMYLNQKPSSISSSNMICNYVIDLVYMITYLQTFLNFNNKRLAFSSNFTLVSHD